MFEQSRVDRYRHLVPIAKQPHTTTNSCCQTGDQTRYREKTTCTATGSESALQQVPERCSKQGSAKCNCSGGDQCPGNIGENKREKEQYKCRK